MHLTIWHCLPLREVTDSFIEHIYYMLTIMLGSSLATGKKEGKNQAKSLTSEFIVQLKETNNKFKYDTHQVVMVLWRKIKQEWQMVEVGQEDCLDGYKVPSWPRPEASKGASPGHIWVKWRTFRLRKQLVQRTWGRCPPGLSGNKLKVSLSLQHTKYH